MSVTAAGATSAASRGGRSSLLNRQLDSYPDSGPRMMYLAITVLATVMLYYELYVAGSVSTLILVKLHISFSFFVYTLAVGNLIGAFGSLFAGLTDRLGRTNLVVYGLVVTGIMVAFVIPASTSKWEFTIFGWFVGVVEGICLVATPALIRDFSPQTGRAAAMGFWTSGPVLGSLVVSVVATNTIGNSPSPSFWTHEYHICGIAGLVVAVLAFLTMRELSPALRDQLMVSMKDRALIEARAKGLDIEAALKNPFGQLLKPDIVVSALGVSIFLLIYYTLVGFGLIYVTTVYGFSVKDGNGLSNWAWAADAIAVVGVGIVSDRLRVRKPLMIIGGVASVIFMYLYLAQSHHGQTTTYYHLAFLTAALSFFLGIAYTPWMASFTETVEARNPALTATGLAIWGWIIRVIVFAAYMILPSVVTSATPLVEHGPTVAAATVGSPRYHVPGTYQAQFAFAQQHPDVVAFAQQNTATLTFAAQHPDVVATATRLAPELAVIGANPTLFTQLQADPTNPALQGQAVQAAGGGTKGVQILQTIGQNQAAILGLLPYASQLTALQQLATAHPQQLAQVQQYSSQLQALGSVPKSVIADVVANGPKVAAAAAKTPGQWRDWFWICLGSMVFFLGCVPLMKGRWSPSAAKADEEAHEAMVQAELAKLGA